jgi:hypothetical protein
MSLAGGFCLTTSLRFFERCVFVINLENDHSDGRLDRLHTVVKDNDQCGAGF